jgi:hypothetical protein
MKLVQEYWMSKFKDQAPTDPNTVREIERVKEEQKRNEQQDRERNNEDKKKT